MTETRIGRYDSISNPSLRAEEQQSPHVNYPKKQLRMIFHLLEL